MSPSATTLVFPVPGKRPRYIGLSGAHQEVGRTGEVEGSESDKLRAARDHNPRLVERHDRDEGRKEDWRGCPREGASTSGSAGVPEEADRGRSPEEVFNIVDAPIININKCESSREMSMALC